MLYMGSKARIAKHILPIMLKEATDNWRTTWVEPFVGGANMIDKVPKYLKRVGIDSNPHTIEALITIRDFPSSLIKDVTEDFYNEILNTDPHPVNSWIRFVCSFGGRFDNGFARNKENRRYSEKAYNNAQKQSKHLKGVQFINANYIEYSNFRNCLIYCDPPYEGTTEYKGYFDHELFWNWARYMSKNNSVYVSEYKAPNDFVCVWEGIISTGFASSRVEATNKAVEKLFTIKKV